MKTPDLYQTAREILDAKWKSAEALAIYETLEWDDYLITMKELAVGLLLVDEPRARYYVQRSKDIVRAREICEESERKREREAAQGYKECLLCGGPVPLDKEKEDHDPART
jgi:hypothetical protein